MKNKSQLNSEMIWKIQKKIVKRQGKYGRKISRNQKRKTTKDKSQETKKIKHAVSNVTAVR